jgi:hypothetical protein
MECTVAAALAAKGNVAAAKERLGALLKKIMSDTHRYSPATFVDDVAGAQARIGDVQAAVETAQRVPEAEQACVFLSIARGQLEAGDIAGARITRGRAGAAGGDYNLGQEIVEALLEKGEATKAEELANELPREEQYDAWIAIIRSYARKGAMEEALRLADTLPGEERTGGRMVVFHVLNKKGLLKEALKTIDGLEMDDRDRFEVVEILARLGQVDKAVQMAQKHNLWGAFSDIALWRLRAGAPKEALQVMAMAGSGWNTGRGYQGILQTYAREKGAAAALEWIDLIENPMMRAFARVGVAEALLLPPPKEDETD